jgi:hypothetical protein
LKFRTILDLFAPDHYAVLRVSRDVGRDGVELTYQDAAARARPWHALFGRSPARLREAYEVLTEPRRRQDHDARIDRLRVNLPIPPM